LVKRTFQSGWLALAVLALLLPARAQVNMGEAAMNLSGDAGFGYNQILDPSQNQWGLTFDATLNGYYYNPKFLSFRVTPYYNTNRANSLSNSLYSTKGFFASGDLFSGSHTPITFSYQRDWNAEGTYNVPGAPGFTTTGNSQMFSVSGALDYANMPTLQVSFSKGNADYNVLGANSTGSTGMRLFNVTSTYSRWGFDFGAMFTNSHLTQDTPLFYLQNLTVSNDTTTNTLQFNVARNLWHNARWTSSVSHTAFNNDAYNSTGEQSYDSFYNTLLWQPSSKLSVVANVDYTTNAGSYLLTLIPGGNPGSILPLYNDSSYMLYSVHGTYLLGRDFTLDGGAMQTGQSYFGSQMDSTSEYASVGYSHELFGGQVGAHYGVNHFSSPLNNQSNFGNMASAAYTRNVAGWQLGAGGNVNTNQMSALVGYHQSGFGANVSASHNFSGWLLMVSGLASKNRIAGLSGTDGMNNTFGVAVSHRNFSVNGSFNRSSGQSMPTPTGLIPTPIPIPGLVVDYTGSSYSAGAGYTPIHRLQLTASYSHSLYETAQPWLQSNSMFVRFDARADYQFRQMHIIGAFTHLNQGLGTNFGTPQTVNTIYFSITRHFDLF
jgi:hypothetical protein